MPITRVEQSSGVQTLCPERLSGTFPPPPSTGTRREPWRSSRSRSPSRRSARLRPQPDRDSRARAAERTRSGTAAAAEEERHVETCAEEPSPLETTRQDAEPPAAGAGDEPTQHAGPGSGPPILASDLLREQMRPSSPGDNALRVPTVALCRRGGDRRLARRRRTSVDIRRARSADHDGDAWR